MRMSARGRALLTKREGVRTKAYLDSVGVWTIGIGHTSAAGPPPVTPGLTLTRAEVDAIFTRDLVKYEDAVNKAVQVPIRQHEFDALTSFCFNVGTGAMSGSSAIRLLNARAPRRDVADALMKWNKPPEIIGRRRSERDQFLTPYSVQDTKTGTGSGAVIGTTAATAAKAGGMDTATAIAIGIGAALLIAVVVIAIRRRKSSTTP